MAATGGTSQKSQKSDIAATLKAKMLTRLREKHLLHISWLQPLRSPSLLPSFLWSMGSHSPTPSPFCLEGGRMRVFPCRSLPHSQFHSHMTSSPPSRAVTALTPELWISGSTTRDILTYIRYATPIILFIVFCTIFLARSILEAKRDPRPLKGHLRRSARKEKGISPVNSSSLQGQSEGIILDFSPSRKGFFLLTNFLLLLTFVANGAIVVVHAVLERQHDYWCGQAYVVRIQEAQAPKMEVGTDPT